MSECWMFYAVPTARVIFTTKTSLDTFSRGREQVWTFSVFGAQIYEMRCLFVAVGRLLYSAASLGQHVSMDVEIQCAPC